MVKIPPLDEADPRAAALCAPENRRFLLIAAILASSLGFIDGSIVAIALPAMRMSLDATLVEAQWISNAYMLALSALILVGGAAGDRLGLARVFGSGIAVFVLASMACAFAPNANFLIGARAVQGLGAAFMVPGSLALICRAYPSNERGKAIGTWAAAAAVTSALGPVYSSVDREPHTSSPVVECSTHSSSLLVCTSPPSSTLPCVSLPGPTLESYRLLPCVVSDNVSLQKSSLP